jgi:superfamily II DNA or RNA helicase/molybdopterin converting factor small subunit
MLERIYQNDAVNASVTAYDNGTRRQLLVMATGTGKTHVFGRLYGEMKSRLPGQMLVIAHTDELVKQNAHVLRYLHGPNSVGLEMGTYTAEPTSPIISASVQTLGRKGTTRLDKFNWNNIDKIVVDEAHHSTTDAYRRILDKSGVLEPTSRTLLLGVTATPQRTDGIALDTLYERVVYLYPIRKAIEEGWLVDIRGYRVRTDTSLDGVSKSSGDYALGELSERINTPQRNQQIVEAWKRLGEGRKTVVYCANIQHTQAVAEEFSRAGVAAEAVWGDDPDRGERLTRHRQGTTNVLCVCGLLIEGYDDPSIACVVLARPTASVILLPQMVGRGTRLEDGINLKDHEFMERVKRNLIVIDIVDATVNGSLVTLPTLMGLPTTLDVEGRSLIAAADALEALQEEHPGVDFSKLERFDDAKILIESVDMFQVKFPEEVKENSELTWFRAVCGGYKMLLPKEGVERAGLVHIYENTLGQWELDGEIKGETFHGIRASFEEAIKVSDEQIRKRVSSRTLSCVLREAKWKNNPVTRGQRKMIERLFPHKNFAFDQMSAGQASHLIAERLTRKATR